MRATCSASRSTAPIADASPQQTLKKIGFDIVSFFIMTPLPGTEDQVRFTKEGEIIDWDFNQLDSQHVTLQHDKLDKESWLGAYRDAFIGFYSIPRFLHRCSPYARAADSMRNRAGRASPVLATISSAIARDVIRWSAASGRFAAATCAAPPITDDEARRFYLGGSASTRSCAATATRIRRRARVSNEKRKSHNLLNDRRDPNQDRAGFIFGFPLGNGALSLWFPFPLGRG